MLQFIYVPLVFFGELELTVSRAVKYSVEKTGEEPGEKWLQRSVDINALESWKEKLHSKNGYNMVLYLKLFGYDLVYQQFRKVVFEYMK